MSEGREAMGTLFERLAAYHDGELSGLARWRFERALRREPALRDELERMVRLREALREQDEAGPGPDLWDAIALRLPAEDARRAEAATGDLRRTAGSLWWLKPAGAAVATLAVAGVVFYGGFWQEAPVTGQVVRWIDSGERSVMVLDDQPDTTIIWVLDGTGDGAWIGGRRDEA